MLQTIKISDMSIATPAFFWSPFAQNIFFQPFTFSLYVSVVLRCTGKTQRDRVEREVGEGIGMGNTCKSMADSCQCMAKTTTIL